MFIKKGRLTQLVRVPPLQGGSREFKSLIAHQDWFEKPEDQKAADTQRLFLYLLIY